jgi:hypothetical protein
MAAATDLNVPFLDTRNRRVSTGRAITSVQRDSKKRGVLDDIAEIHRLVDATLTMERSPVMAFGHTERPFDRR